MHIVIHWSLSMSTQQSNWNILSLMLIPFTFVLFVFTFVLMKDSGAQPNVPSQEYVVGLASIVVVSVAAVACLVTATLAAQPRINW